MAEEVELKLELSADAADAIEATPLLPGKPAPVLQVATYFDTDDHLLARAGFPLRIRRGGGKHIQTIKADGAGSVGLFARTEWERPIDGDVPILDSTTPLPGLLGEALGRILPLFDVRVERRTWMIDRGEAAIELVLDRGEVVLGAHRAPICELELELKSGDRAALFDLARELDAVAPLRLGVQSKSERGYLLTRPAPAAVKAEPLLLRGDMTTADAFRCITAACVRQFRLNEAIFLAGRDLEALHQARVALRRLRSAFRLFKPIIGDDGANIRRALDWLASELGEARNFDVLAGRADAGALRDRIAAAREIAYGEVCDALLTARARWSMLDLVAWQAPCSSERGEVMAVAEFAPAALDRLRRKVKRRGAGLGEGDRERHDFRKCVKEMRYASEFFAHIFEGKGARQRHKRYVSLLETLQGQLGALNDFATASAIFEQLGLSGHPEVKRLAGAGMAKKKLLRAAVRTRDDLLRTKPFW